VKAVFLLLAPVLLALAVSGQAVPGDQGPLVTYTISLGEDGSAIWNMEYRTPLLSAADQASFRNFSEAIQSLYLPDFTELMKRSAAEASTATGRPVGVTDFSADSAVQSGPTGSYGVIHYRCRWTGFAEPGESLEVGDVFVGGLYLGKDHALILRPPPGFTPAEVSPPADLEEDSLVWYGLRSFGAGEPRVVFAREAGSPVPWVPLLLLGAAGLALGIYASRRRFRRPPPPAPEPEAGEGLSPDPAGALELEDRILALLGERGGSLFQSEIVGILGLPKSTVSEAVNRLHGAGKIEKVKKGRENLIRLK
jgi:uncharacterized membrane protein